jgi:hypothetical protein
MNIVVAAWVIPSNLAFLIATVLDILFLKYYIMVNVCFLIAYLDVFKLVSYLSICKILYILRL